MALFKKFNNNLNLKPGSEDQYLLSIVENLNNILNTKKGYGSFINDFGMKDMNEYCSRDDIGRAVMQEVKENIERFEPRLKLINITMEENDNPFRISFKIESSIRKSKKSLRMEFDSVFNDFHVADFRG